MLSKHNFKIFFFRIAAYIEQLRNRNQRSLIFDRSDHSILLIMRQLSNYNKQKKRTRNKKERRPTYMRSICQYRIYIVVRYVPRCLRLLVLNIRFFFLVNFDRRRFVLYVFVDFFRIWIWILILRFRRCYRHFIGPSRMFNMFRRAWVHLHIDQLRGRQDYIQIDVLEVGHFFLVLLQTMIDRVLHPYQLKIGLFEQQGEGLESPGILDPENDRDVLRFDLQPFRRIRGSSVKPTEESMHDVSEHQVTKFQYLVRFFIELRQKKIPRLV